MEEKAGTTRRSLQDRAYSGRIIPASRPFCIIIFFRRGMTGDGLVRQLRWNECAASRMYCCDRPGL